MKIYGSAMIQLVELEIDKFCEGYKQELITLRFYYISPQISSS